MDIALRFYEDELLDESGYSTIVERDGEWCEYSKQGWEVVPEKRILSRITTFMQNESDLRPFSKGYILNSVKVNLASDNHYGHTAAKLVDGAIWTGQLY